MIKKFDDRNVSIKENLKGGCGALEFRQIASAEELLNKIKMYTNITIKPNDSVGYHRHDGEEEIMLINKGEGTYCDDGVESLICQGDVAICFDGHSHSIQNKANENLEITAIIIEK